MGILMAIAMIISLMAGLTQVAHAATTISSVGLNLVLPSAGDSYSGTAATSITSGTGFTITKANWYNGGTPETNPGCGSAPTSFEAGKPYYAEIELTAVDGYGFTESTAVTLTGGATVKTTQFDHGDKTLLIITKDITLSGAASYTYTFDFNGGSCTIPLASISYDPEAGLPSGPPSVITPPEGKVFDAWEIDGVRYEAGAKYSATANFVLKILWKDAPAVTKYPVWVGDTQVTSANKDDILGDGKASFDPTTNTLTLNDSSISGFTSGAKIYADSLDLIISGSAILKGDDTGIEVYNGSLTVNGYFTVEVTFDAIIADNVSITGGIVDISADVGINTSGNLTISGGTVTADCNDTAISVDGDVTISGGSVTATSGYGAGIHSDSSITIDGGSVTATGDQYGLYCDNYEGKIEISGGTVNATGTMDEGIYCTGHININGGTVEVNGGGLGIYTPRILTIGNGIGSVTVISHSDTAVHAHTIALGDELMIKEPENGTVGYKSGGDTILKESGDIADKVVIVPKEAPVTTYPVWVGSTQVTSTNKDDILGDGGKAKFDPDTNTLTLDNPTVSSSLVGIICYNPSSSDPELLKITGSATLGDGITSVGILGVGVESSTIELNGNFDITGTECGILAFNVIVSGGNVTVHGGASGISVDKEITISGGTVNATGDTRHGIVSDKKSITISGGIVTANGEKYAIYANTGISISNAAVTAVAGDGMGTTGIFTETGDITISGGTVKVTAGEGGIYAYDGDVKIENGTEKVEATVGTVAVRGKNGITIGDELMIKIPEGGTVENNSGSYDIMDGSSAARHALIVPKEAPVTEYPVWVQGIQATDSNKDDVLGDGKVSFDPSTNTLTLSGASISDTTEKPAIYTLDADLLITGSATISVANGHSGIMIDKDESSGGTLSLENAQLTISGESEGYQDAIEAYNTISIENSTVKITGFYGGIRTNDGDLTISGSTVNAASSSYGFHVDGTLTIANDITSVHATSTDSDALSAMYGKTIVLGDQLMIKTPEGGEIGTGLGELYHGQVIFESGGTTQAKEVLIVPKEATTYTVTFDPNSGSGTMTPNPVTVVAGEKLTLPECTFTPPSADKEFDKWDAGKPGEQVDITSDCVIRAIWKEKTVATYTVTFDANGHGTAPAVQTVEDGKTATKPADPTETGWTFGGWYKEAVCTNAFDFSTPITADITLYAKWTEESITPGVITYTVVSGGDSTWIKDSTSTITITVKRSEADDTCFSHFTGVQIDGTALAASDYEAKAGSTLITLKAATLQKLSTGSHTVTVIFDDGKAETSVTVKAATSPEDSKSPKTGDNNHLGLWIVLVIISAIWLGTAVLIRKKNRYTSKH